MRWLMPQPCIGASDSALSTSKSSVPCRTSDDEAATGTPVGCSREYAPLLSNAQGYGCPAWLACVGDDGGGDAGHVAATTAIGDERGVFAARADRRSHSACERERSVDR